MKFYKTTKNRVNIDNNCSIKDIWAINLSAILILILFLIATPAVAQFAGGSGTEEDPYQIETIEQLQKIGESAYQNSHFIQVADIDASDTKNWNDGQGFEPLMGSFYYDGQGHVISDLTINRSNQNSVGLFGHVGSSVLENIGLKNVEITGNWWVGGLVGDSETVQIVNSWVTGKVTGNRDVGGLVGRFTIDCGMDNTGMIVGEGAVLASYTDVHVTGEERVGGLIGIIDHIMYTGKISEAELANKYAMEEDIQHIISLACGVFDTYAAGQVTGDKETGGLFGFGVTEAMGSSFWDMETTGQNVSTGGGEEYSKAVGLTTEQMTGQNAFVHMYKLDFEQTWQLTEGYPVLRWQDPEDAVEPPQVPIIRVDTTKRDFGIVSKDSSVTVEVSIRNTGNNVLNGEVQIAGPNAGLFVIADGLSTFSLEVGTSQAVGITFNPGGLENYEAELHVVHDAPNRSDTLVISLVGQGKEPTDATPDPDLPGELALHQNYPNPFNPSTRISYEMSEPSEVLLQVYTITGQRIAVLHEGYQPAGYYKVSFDGSGLASGIYIYRLHTQNMVLTRKFTLIK